MTLKEFRNQYYRIGLMKLKNARTGKRLPHNLKGKFDDWTVKFVDVGIEVGTTGNTAHAYLEIEIEED